MCKLTRKAGESFRIGTTRIYIERVSRSGVTFSIHAPPDVVISLCELDMLIGTTDTVDPRPTRLDGFTFTQSQDESTPPWDPD